MNMKGSCLCGAVSYHCAVAPALSGNCHCRDCQKASGSGYAPTFFVAEDAVSIAGEVKYYSHIADSGKRVWRGFCPTCGSQLFGKVEAMPGLLAIRAGTLDDPAQYHPDVDIYTSRAAPWDPIPDSATTFPEMPPRPGG